MPPSLRFRLALFFAIGLASAGADAAPDQARPWESTALSLESGLLWQVGSSTPLSYRLVPTQLSWRSREFLSRPLGRARLVLRHRLTLLVTAFQQGPESHYLALNASPSIELWSPAGRWCGFGGAGGGLGWLDSQGVRGGQGQDFTFNWFARGGVEHLATKNFRWSAGVMFQHLSNGGQTKPNPGIDAVGFTFGGSWAF